MKNGSRRILTNQTLFIKTRDNRCLRQSGDIEQVPADQRWLTLELPDEGRKYTRPATQFAPELCKNESLNLRAQGKPGAQCTRSLVRKVREHTS